MKILLCNTTDSGGGAAKAALRLLDGFRHEGHDAEMLVLSKSQSNPRVLDTNEFKSNHPLTRLYRDLKRKILFQYKSYQWSKYPKKIKRSLHDVYVSYLEDALKHIEFDLLHLHWVEGGFVNFKELQNVDKPIVWTLHGSFPFTGICHHLLCDRYKTRCGACPALGSTKENDFSTRNFSLKQKRYRKLNLTIISPSRYLAEKAKESTLLGDRDVHVIPNGIDTDLFSPASKSEARKRLDLEEKPTILFGAVGFHSDPNKGFELLRESLYRLSEFYSGWQLQLIVFGGISEEEIPFPIWNAGFVKDEEELKWIYSAADVMVVPSKHENLPYTIMESLSCATPVTAFNIGGNGEMIGHKENGYLAEPFKSEDLAEGIRWCLENNGGNVLGKNGRQKVLTNYQYKEIAKQHIELYDIIRYS